jgi:hypothetical protein
MIVGPDGNPMSLTLAISVAQNRLPHHHHRHRTQLKKTSATAAHLQGRIRRHLLHGFDAKGGACTCSINRRVRWWT